MGDDSGWDALPDSAVSRWHAWPPILFLILGAEAVYIGGVLALGLSSGGVGLDAFWTWMPVPLMLIFGAPLLWPEWQEAKASRAAGRFTLRVTPELLKPRHPVTLTLAWNVPESAPAVRRLRISLIEVLVKRAVEDRSIHRRHDIRLRAPSRSGERVIEFDAPFEHRLTSGSMRSVFTFMADFNTGKGQWWRLTRSVSDEVRGRPLVPLGRGDDRADTWPTFGPTGGETGGVSAKHAIQWTTEREGRITRATATDETEDDAPSAEDE